MLYIPAPHTIYREVRKLEAGHVLVWRDGQITVRRYWDLSQFLSSAADRRQPADVEAELLELLTDALRRHLISDVPLGVFLSGGLDSSSIVALMRRAQDAGYKVNLVYVGVDAATTTLGRIAQRVASGGHTVPA